MAKSIKDVFEQELKHLTVNSRFATAISKYERNFVNSSEDRLEFLGGALIGTPPFRFYATDRNGWFDEILEVDDMALKNELHSLPSIDPSRNVTSDVLNLSVAWTVHALMNATNISPRQREDAMVAALKIMHYRFIGSRMAHVFRYEPDRKIAEATYAALSNKFALKREGSWAKMLESRCRDIVSPRGIHYRTLQKFTDDDAILYFISDTQTRIRSVIKKMVAVFYDVRDRGGQIKGESQLLMGEDGLQLRDIVKMQSQYVRYSHTVLSDRKTFIRPEVTKVITEVMHTLPERHLQTALEYMADNASRRGDRNIEPLVEEVILHAIAFMDDNRNEFRHDIDLSKLITRLKSLYMSSRSTDSSLMKMRDLSMKIAKKAIRTNNASLLSSIRTGMMLYVALRVFSMRYFTSGVSVESRAPTLDEMMASVI